MKTAACAVALAALLRGASAQRSGSGGGTTGGGGGGGATGGGGGGGTTGHGGGGGSCPSYVKDVKFYASRGGNNRLTGIGANDPMVTSLDDVKYRPGCNEPVTFRLPFTATSSDATDLTFMLTYDHGVEGWSWTGPAGGTGNIRMAQGSADSLWLKVETNGIPEFKQDSKLTVTVHWKGKLAAGETCVIAFDMVTGCDKNVCARPPPPSSTFGSTLDSVKNHNGCEENSAGQQCIKAKIDCDHGVGCDPHVWGFEGTSYYFDGKAGESYAFIHDKDVSINIGVAPRYADGSAPYSDIVSAGMVFRNTVPDVADRRVAVLDAATACAAGVAEACNLPAFGIVTMLDGEMLPLGMMDRGDIQVAIAEMPHFCKIDPDALDRDYGMTDELTGDATAGRSLRGAELHVEASAAFDFKQWVATGRILGAPSEKNDFVNDCTDFLSTHDVFGHHTYGELTTIMVRTAAITLRVEHWSFLDADQHLPAEGKHSVAAVPLMLNIYPQDHWRPTETAHGLLGQTVRPLAPGQAPMEGEEEDYRVDSLFATSFKFYP
ncbi:unnamed protein product [Phaeothamnion confervicola]